MSNSWDIIERLEYLRRQEKILRNRGAHNEKVAAELKRERNGLDYSLHIARHREKAERHQYELNHDWDHTDHG